MADDVQAVEDLVSRYQQAAIDGDMDAKVGCIAFPAFGVNGNNASDPRQWTAFGLATEERTRARGMDVPYENEFEVLHSHVQNDLGVVVTRDTGSDGENTWENVVNVYFAGKIDGEWKLMGAMFGAPPSE